MATQNDYDLVEILYQRRTSLPAFIEYLRRLFIEEIKKANANNGNNNNGDNDDNDHDVTAFEARMKRVQLELLNRTSTNELWKKITMAPEYERAFLSKWIKMLEELLKQHNKNGLICDELYEVFSQKNLIQTENRMLGFTLESFLPGPYHSIAELHLFSTMTKLLKSDLSYGFKVNKVGNIELILLEGKEMVAYGTNGLRTWPASLHLLEFMLQRELMKKHGFFRYPWRNIVELGAGAGSLGIGLIKSNTISGQYTFTDNSVSVLDRLSTNLIVNGLHQGPQLQVQKLDWTNRFFKEVRYQPKRYTANYVPFNAPFDLVLATDVLFDPELIQPLVQTIADLINDPQPSDSSGRPADCLICIANRNPELETDFRDKLEKLKLSMTPVDFEANRDWETKLRNRLAELVNNQGEDGAAVVQEFIPLERSESRTKIYRIGPSLE